MPHLLSVSRAARLAGISRGALQQRIKDGDLTTFEGHVVADDLLRLYPDVRLDDESEHERVNHIKESAFAKRVRDRLMPDAETLAARVQALGMELVRARAIAEHYVALVEQLRKTAADMPHATASQLIEMLDEIGAPPDAAATGLAVHDTLLRIMAAQVRNAVTGHDFFVDGAESILDAALRAGLAFSYGCSDGSCGKCRARIVSGRTKPVRDACYELTPIEIADGRVLMCCQTAVTDVVLEAAEAQSAAEIQPQSVTARVKSIEPTPSGVNLLHLQTPPDHRLRFLAGQHVELGLPDGSTRTAALAGCPCDDRNLYFHLRDLPQLNPGDEIAVRGPTGDFVLNANSARPLLFIACDDGFAPIKGMLEHAMALDSAPAMYLLWAAHPNGHYMNNLCRAWADSLDNLSYTALTPDDDLYERALDRVPDLEDCEIYLAGPAAWCDVWRRQFQIHGVAASQLHVQHE